MTDQTPEQQAKSHARMIANHIFGEYLHDVRTICERLGANPPPLDEVKDSFDAGLTARVFANTWKRCDAEAARVAHRARELKPSYEADSMEYRRMVCRMSSPLVLDVNSRKQNSPGAPYPIYASMNMHVYPSRK